MTDALKLFTEIWQHHRHIVYLLAGWYLFNCAVQAMPKPNGVHGGWYAWLHGTLHGIAGNWRLILKVLRDRKLPDEPVNQTVAVGFECIACGVVMADTLSLKFGPGAAPYHRVTTRCSECTASSAGKLP